LLGTRRQDVLGLLLAAQAATAADSFRGEGSDRRDELGRVLALLVESDPPQPGEGRHFGEALLLRTLAADVPEVDVAVGCDARDNRQERALQVFELDLAGRQTTADGLRHRDPPGPPCRAALAREQEPLGDVPGAGGER